jgi:hypothetical protein
MEKILQMQNFIEEPWMALEVEIRLAPPFIRRRGTPDIYVLLEQDGKPLARFDVYSGDTPSPFSTAMIWKQWVVIGFSDFLHFFSLENKSIVSRQLDSYFGSLYSAQEVLLVASGTELLCFDAQAKLCWQRQHLAIDGVIVQAVENHKIFGKAERNPPGGWHPFTLSLESGRDIT